ncbi:MAG: sugar phosphate isomerase/epimerase family protein [Sedimentisphaerales bacterium]|jgi:sugar phosphate isomerase/epimerase|nr:sugar phosphate isomerase/epimerase family protein [Sedimentisphaerales bacterium]HNY77747.1 sugar phosphate isomerase/epimerase family protein [Sedimentisphaerales bacterium]HOC63491.1 sugar phosphate isomerase/epimerase family protein [Sedimentisphaerales bacterium]HOH63922.1 sugar phosphate isomerase/epimerase family protein [Sedimentisphaerales bacterium]HPY49083.1 sugar phosphate isomerase/epimerase family protein [Sedimentisphaerales bacterium]
MAKLSAFADEVTEDLRCQVEFLAKEKVGYIEPRFINRKNIMDLNPSELKEARTMIRDHGLKVSAIGSPIGKVRLDEPFEPHLDKFKHAVDLAQFFETPFIRMFSYYAPQGKDIDDYRDQVMERMAAKVQVVEGTDVTMVHENEAHIYGHTAENCADLVETIGSERLRLAYDPANFVWSEKITNNVEVCWPVMKPYVVHVHIKDWKLGSADIGSLPGQGDGQIKELLAALAAVNYDGCMTMEPHLKTGGQFGGSTGPELFSKAIAAVRELADEVGLACD